MGHSTPPAFFTAMHTEPAVKYTSARFLTRYTQVMSDQSSPRLFLAISLPEPIRLGLIAAAAGVRGATESVRWARAEGLHLTLVFLGARPAEQVDEIAGAAGAACAEARPFSLTVGGHGCFPSPARARVLWVGLEGETAALISLQQAIRAALVAARLVEPGERFTPHLTMGRVRETTGSPARADLGHRWLALPSPEPAAFLVREVHLINSVLGPEGSRYTSLRTLPLGNG